MEPILAQITEWLDQNEGVISAIVGLLIISGGIWSLLLRSAQVTRQESPKATEPANAQDQKTKDKPSIAVMPLTTAGRDEELDDLAEALTDELISMLSRSPNFFVISRNSCFAYKDRQVDARNVAGELGVRYLVEGGLRRTRAGYRINIELISGVEGAHIWSDSFDFPEDELLDAQAEVVLGISTQLANPILLTETSDSDRLASRDVNAWLLTQRAMRQYYINTSDPDRAKKTKALLQTALKSDPEYAPALGFKALVYSVSLMLFPSKNPDKDVETAKQSATRAYELAPMDPSVLWCCGVTWGFLGSPRRGLPLLKKSVEMDPNNAHALADYGYQLVRVGDREEGVALIRSAIRHSPKDPRKHIWIYYLGVAAVLDDPDEGLQFFREAINLDESYMPAWIAKIIVHELLNQKDKSQEAAQALRRLSPQTNRETLERQFALGGSTDESVNQLYLSMLQQAGVFE